MSLVNWIKAEGDNLVPKEGARPGKLIASYLNSNGYRRIVMAEYVSKFSKKASEFANDVDCDFLDLDPESDQFYLPPGWYEVLENWGDYTSVFIGDGEVDHYGYVKPPTFNYPEEVRNEEVLEVDYDEEDLIYDLGKLKLCLERVDRLFNRVVDRAIKRKSEGYE